MGPYGIVVTAPAFDDDLGFAQRVEDLAVEQLVPQACIEALDVAVLPWTSRLYVRRLGAHSRDPFLKRLGHELRPIIRPDVAWNASQDEQVRQYVDHVDCLEPAVDPDRQAFVRKLVEDVEHPVFAPVVGAVLHEVVGPDVIGMFRPQADAGTIPEPQPASFGLFMGDLQPLTPPDPFHPPIADRPARLTQQGSDLAIAIAAILAGQFDCVGCQLFGILLAPRDLALRRAVLPERRAGATLGDVQIPSDMLDAGATARGA